MQLLQTMKEPLAAAGLISSELNRLNNGIIKATERLKA
jgi:hypothetical protein